MSRALIAALDANTLLALATRHAQAGDVREDLNRLIKQWMDQGLTMSVSALERTSVRYRLFQSRSNRSLSHR
jgi:hypothetical protein